MSAKLKQLCRQVELAVNDVLADSDDPALNALYVNEVTPGAHVHQLIVILANSWPEPGFDPAFAKAEVEKVYGLIREEVAASIHRKKVPELKFFVLWPGEMRVSGI